MNKSQEEKIHGQINGAFKQSFLDLLTEQISSSTPDVQWFVRLYVELRYLPHGPKSEYAFAGDCVVHVFDQFELQ